MEEIQGSASEAAIFTTPSCEPDQPLPPKLLARTKNSLQLRWNAPTDNGAHIQQYILEYDEGRGAEFVEIIRIKSKQYSLSKLQPSTWYCFRLAAINECGKSTYSDIITYCTAGNPPVQMPPPILQAATTYTLRLAWQIRGNADEDFCLQLADSESGHGFLTCYTGRDAAYECVNLKRATGYQFRIRAENEAGTSAWSDTVTYATLSERPGRPQKLHIKGKVHATHFRAKWDAPSDKGGAEIQAYTLQLLRPADINTVVDDFETVYTGSESEATCDRLQPGTTYHVRVACQGPAGCSNYCDPLAVTTDAVVPGAPATLQCGSTPGPYAAMLRWDAPTYNGGAVITEYETKLNCSTANSEFKNLIIFRGNERQCVAKDLVPGERYDVQVRAYNRIGAGPWSEPSLTFDAGAAAPFAPEQPEIAVKSSSCMTVKWLEPFANGSPIIEYQLASARLLDAAADEVEAAAAAAKSSPKKSDASYAICYQGVNCTTDVKHLVPFTKYSFKVCALNAAGCSLYSAVAVARTPPAVPAAPVIESHTSKATEITLRWRQPDCNGAPILYYNIECADRITRTNDGKGDVINEDDDDTDEDTDDNAANTAAKHTVVDLSPETAYKCKVQAVNECGAGPYSHAMRIVTCPLPPRPPPLECTGIGHNFLKLKWGDSKNTDFTRYDLQMYNGRAKKFQPIYEGNLLTFKVNKLQEQTGYTFRICSESDAAGKGEWSELYEFKTVATLPGTIRPPRCVEQDGSDLLLEWPHSRNVFADPVEYVLQVQQHHGGGKDVEFKQVSLYLYRFSIVTPSTLPHPLLSSILYDLLQHFPL